MEMALEKQSTRLYCGRGMHNTASLRWDWKWNRKKNLESVVSLDREMVAAMELAVDTFTHLILVFLLLLLLLLLRGR
jgi:hypothetical protein